MYQVAIMYNARDLEYAHAYVPWVYTLYTKGPSL